MLEYSLSFPNFASFDFHLFEKKKQEDVFKTQLFVYTYFGEIPVNHHKNDLELLKNFLVECIDIVEDYVEK